MNRDDRRVRRPFLPGACAILMTMMLGACASSNKASLIHLPDGQTGYAVNCSGADAGSSWASCYVLAGQKCGATGYDIVSKDNEEGGPTGGGITNVVSVNVKNRSMIVRCK
ncbi:putative Lipoprotein [Candidatus Burkholderia pumila]|uniref:Lipoprotein n=1 Tax=Candidatus Burkholderia pumila TaxID=1090375 RepID=A0ABR5HKW6_9BURK|nr:putative Lipoprotein [Candidatus Burkholderia pumila]